MNTQIILDGNMFPNPKRMGCVRPKGEKRYTSNDQNQSNMKNNIFNRKHGKIY